MSVFGDKKLYDTGAALRGEILGAERLQQALADEDDLDHYYHLYGHECAYAQIWARPQLSRHDRALSILAMLCALAPSSHTVRVHIRGCIRVGCTRGEIRQVLAMVTWYAGVPVGSLATHNVREALGGVPEEAARIPAHYSDDAPKDLDQRGAALMVRLGIAPVRSTPDGSAHAAHADIQRTHYFGVLWSNTELGLRERALVLLGVICGCGRTTGAARHFALARKAGCTAEDIEEVLLSAGIYCGELVYDDLHAQYEAFRLRAH